MKGIVYILTNPAMPGILKIGRTTRGDLKQRMNELFSTGVPVPFECAFACEVDDCDQVERAFHIAFGPNRIHPKREFFKIEPEQPIAILKLFEKKETTAEVEYAIDAQTTELDREAGKRLKQRRPPLQFLEMGIPIESKLAFAHGDAEVTVVAERKVMYEGKENSLTQITRELLGLDYSVAPAPHWLYNGKNLRDIYRETYGE
jgi:hypothetical protein